MITILQDFVHAMTVIVANNGGNTQPFFGNTLICWFEDSPNNKNKSTKAVMRAMQAVVDMKDKSESMREKLIEKNEINIEAGFGAHTGVVVLGSRFDISSESGLIGDDVNLSVQLSSKADHGEILISEQTYHLAGDHLEVQSIEMMSVKWKNEPFEVYCILNFIFNLSSERRRYKRKEVGLKVLLRTESMRKSHAEVAVNISAGGFRMMGSLTLTQGSRVYVTIHLPGDIILEGLTAQILESYRRDDGKRECRAMFLDLPDDARNEITKFVYV